MAKLPEFVYLVTVDSEWPVSAIADDHPSTPDRIEREIVRRCQSGNVPTRSNVHIWRVPVAEAVEVELQPSTVTPPVLRVKP